MKIRCCILLIAQVAWATAHCLGQVPGEVRPIANYDPESGKLKVYINGQLVRTSAYKDFHYAHFTQKGKVQVSVGFTENIESFKISPLSRKIEAKKTGDRSLAFSLEKPAYTVVTLNKSVRLFLFGDPAIDARPPGLVSVLTFNADPTGMKSSTAAIQKAINESAKNKRLLYFPPGIYRSGRLRIPSGAKIHFAAGALLKAVDDIRELEDPGGKKPRGFINIPDADQVSISGLGVIDGNGRFLRDKYGDDARFRLFLVRDSRDINISGITARDPGSWNTHILRSNNVNFTNVKQLNDAALANTDGFDPDASSDVTIEDCFGYCGDDNVAVKITQQDAGYSETKNIIVRNCVFLTRKSSLKVGTESRGTLFKDIVFENNDVIMADRGMALYCSDGALYQDIRFLSNRFEENYPDAKRMIFQFQINKRNADSKAGKMKNIVLQNNEAHTAFPNPSEIRGLDADHRIEGTIRNWVVAGKRPGALKDANFNVQFAEIVFD